MRYTDTPSRATVQASLHGFRALLATLDGIRREAKLIADQERLAWATARIAHIKSRRAGPRWRTWAILLRHARRCRKCPLQPPPDVAAASRTAAGPLDRSSAHRDVRRAAATSGITRVVYRPRAHSSLSLYAAPTPRVALTLGLQDAVSMREEHRLKP